MTSVLPRATEAEQLAGLTRDQYVSYKLRTDLKTMGVMFFFFWIVDSDTRSMGYLAAVYLFILALARFDHARKWDRAHASGPRSLTPGQHLGA